MEDNIHQKDEAAIQLHTKTFSAWVEAQFRNSLQKFSCSHMVRVVTKELKNANLLNALVEVYKR